MYVVLVYFKIIITYFAIACTTSSRLKYTEQGKFHL
jgi:hypothetical protein